MDSAVALQLPTLRWGVGNARTALLVHGVAGSAGTWWRIGASLAEHGFDVTAPDLRGHGRAPGATSFRFADHAADLALLGRQWDVIVGHSLGSAVSATLVLGGVGAGRLVLIDPVVEIAAAEFEDVVAAQLAESAIDADPAAIAAANPRWLQNEAFHKAQAARAVSPYAVERTMRDNAPWNHAGLLTSLTVPVHILGGDPAVYSMFPTELAGRVGSANPLVTYRVVEGTGHSPQRERPEVVLAAILG
jgi:pimeloyl-ACP methyl ester carboxylesterase